MRSEALSHGPREVGMPNLGFAATKSWQHPKRTLALLEMARSHSLWMTALLLEKGWLPWLMESLHYLLY